MAITTEQRSNAQSITGALEATELFRAVGCGETKQNQTLQVDGKHRGVAMEGRTTVAFVAFRCAAHNSIAPLVFMQTHCFTISIDR